MSDEKPVPETLETIAASIRDLRKAMDSRFDEVDARFGKVDARFDEVDARFGKVDARFGEVDARFGEVDARFDEFGKSMGARFNAVDSRFDEFGKSMDSRFDELKAQLRTEIESVRGDVRLVAEAFGSQAGVNQRNEEAHRELKKRLDGHDTRIVALEQESRGESPA
jgi:hypothetical protein